MQHQCRFTAQLSGTPSFPELTFKIKKGLTDKTGSIFSLSLASVLYRHHSGTIGSSMSKHFQLSFQQAVQTQEWLNVGP